jgi:hypothetical protein
MNYDVSYYVIYNCWAIHRTKVFNLAKCSIVAHQASSAKSASDPLSVFWHCHDSPQKLTGNDPRLVKALRAVLAHETLRAGIERSRA